MNTVDKIGSNKFFFKDVVIDDTRVVTPETNNESKQISEHTSDTVNDARQRFIEQTRNAWKGGSHGE